MLIEEKIYTVAEVADMFKVHHRSIRKLIDNREIEYFRVGSQFRITEDSIKRFIGKRSKKEQDQIEKEMYFKELINSLEDK